MIEREDGPVKHYRMVCDTCGKRTKRFAYGFSFQYQAPPGWREEETSTGWNIKHYCPKCNGVTIETKSKEIVPHVGDEKDMSDHDAVHLPLTRVAVNELVVILDGRHWVITSDTAIKVEEIEE